LWRRDDLRYAVLALLPVLQISPISVASGADAGHASVQAYSNAEVAAQDDVSGIKVAVDSNGTGVTATNRSGHVIWRKDVVQETGLPRTGNPVVRDIKVSSNGTVLLLIGKHRYVEADIYSGVMHLLLEE
jgi:hypothetical protein